MKSNRIRNIILRIVIILVAIVIAGGASFIAFKEFSYRQTEHPIIDEIASANDMLEIASGMPVSFDFIMQGDEIRSADIDVDYMPGTPVNVIYNLTSCDSNEFLYNGEVFLDGVENKRALSLSFIGNMNRGVKLEEGKKYRICFALLYFSGEACRLNAVNYIDSIEDCHGCTINGIDYPRDICRAVRLNSYVSSMSLFLAFLALISAIIIGIAVLFAINIDSISLFDREMFIGKDRLTLGQWIRFFSYFVFTLCLIWGRGNFAGTSNAFLMVTIVLSITGYAVDSRKKAVYTKIYCIQCIVIIAIIDFLFIVGMINKNADRSHSIIIASEIVFLFIATMFWTKGMVACEGKRYVDYCEENPASCIALKITEKDAEEGTNCIKDKALPANIKKRSIINTLTKFVKSEYYLLIILAIVIIISVDTFKWLPLWDNEIYLNGYFWHRGWDFTFSYYEAFGIAGHLNLASMMLLFPGYALSSDLNLGTRIMLLINICGAIVCLYYMMKKLLSGRKSIEVMLATLIIVVFPPVLSMQSVNLDYMMLIPLIIMMFAYYYDLNVIMVLSAVLLCFAKETGPFLCAGFALGIFVKSYFENRKDGKCCIISCMSLRQYMRLIVPMVIWLAVFMAPRIVRTININIPDFSNGYEVSHEPEIEYTQQWGTKVVYNEEEGHTETQTQSWNHFGAHEDYIFSGIGQMTTYHFLWIPLVAAVGSLILGLLKRRRQVINALLPILFSALMFSVINCIYTTYNVYRYKSNAAIAFLIVFVVMVFSYFEEEKLRMVFAAVCILLMTVESYTLIDPVTMLQGNTYSNGNGTILYPDKKEPLYFYSGIQNNQQGYDYGLFLQEILRAVDCDERTLLLIPEMREQDNGASMTGLHERFNIWYSSENEKMDTYIWDGAEGFIVNWGCLKNNGRISLISGVKSVKDIDRIFVIDIPYCDLDTAENMMQKTGLKEAGRISASYRTWKTDIIECAYNN